MIAYKHNGLKRELGLAGVFSIAAGAMISSGLFVLPALAFAKAGPAAVFSYALAGILVLPAMLSKAELATAMPRAGGVYFFLERSMGAAVGTVGGLASWFSLCFKSAFALVGMGIFTALINPGITGLYVKLVAVGCCLLFMIINIIGVKETGRLQVIMVVFLIGILLYYGFRGFLFIQPQRYVPVIPYGLHSVFATAGFVFVSFGGLTKICCAAEEVENPGRNIPLGMFCAFIVVIFLYALVVFVTVGLLDPQQLSSSLTPVSLGASVFMGKLGSILLAVAALLAFITTANAGILTASRDAMAMSRDCILPNIFQKINLRFKTPYISIISTAVFMMVVIIFFSLENLVKTASTLMVLLFSFVNLAVIVMRESKIHSYRPKFHAPLYPWLQIFGIIGYGFILFQMGFIPLTITGIFIACALTWYLVYGRKGAKRQAALVHIIERITARELVNSTLPDELKEIIIERDNIIEDRFDQLIKDCDILDIDQSVSFKDAFLSSAKVLSKRLNIGEDILFNLLMEREKQSSTVFASGLAIPHIIIQGEDTFEILLVRCRGGIIFPESPDPVHTLFILAGTKGERNFHLRALAAIAQIAQDKEFDKNWLAAQNIEQLRRIILLAERKRMVGK